MAARACFDLQVNGYAGADFNAADLTPAQLHDACERLDRDGGAGCLAAIITDDVDVMCRRLSSIAAAREADALIRRVIAGLHIEGPFLNERDGYRGAHPRDAIRPADPDVARRLLDAAGGLARIVTLAPERDPGFRVTRLLTDAGVIVSAGHCDPTTDELRGAMDAGLSMFTHLGNGCPMLLPRHDNVIQRVLSVGDRLWITFIADGIHIPFAALGNYLRCADLSRCVVVSDSIAPAGLGPGRYTLGRWNVDVGADLSVWSPDRTHLVGSAVSLPVAASRLRTHLGLSDDVIGMLTDRNPRAALGR